jgi:PAS domain S-box-containing protein
MPSSQSGGAKHLVCLRHSGAAAGLVGVTLSILSILVWRAIDGSGASAVFPSLAVLLTGLMLSASVAAGLYLAGAACSASRAAASARADLEAETAVLTRVLTERVKELNLQQQASCLLFDPELDRDQVMQRIVDLIASGWPHAEHAAARIRLGDREYSSAGFAESPLHQGASIGCGDAEHGAIEVFDPTGQQAAGEGRLLGEQRRFLETLAQQIASYLSHLETEHRLKQEQQQLITLFEGTDDVIYVADPRTYELLYVNSAFRRLLGDQVIGRDCFKVLQDRDSPCPFCTNPIIFGEKLGQTHVWEFQNEITKRWFRCADKAIRWSDGRMVRYEVATDVTAEKQMQQERRQLDKMSALGRLTAGVAHELNNPLMGIINYVQYCLSETTGEDPLHEALHDIERETRRCIGIVQDLLTYARSSDEGGAFVDCDLWKLVDRSLRLLDYRLRAEGVDLEVDKSAVDLPRLALKPDKFQQVIVNLLTNALDAMKGCDKAVLRIGCRLEGGWVSLCISDTGAGIPLAIRDQVFDPFFTTKAAGQGTGLGLPTCLGIVREHGGELSFTSRVGLGTTMTVRIPTTRDNEEQPWASVS